MFSPGAVRNASIQKSEMVKLPALEGNKETVADQSQSSSHPLLADISVYGGFASKV